MAPASPSLAVSLAGLHRTFGPDQRSYVELARIAEDAGADQIVLADHLVMGDRTDRYPFGTFPFKPDEPWMEPLTTLAAIAGATQRVRLVTGILIVPLRPAAVVAKTVATLDNLSGGRVDLGVGVGWQPEEYESVGIPFAERWKRLDDTLRACRVLWRDVPASFKSDTVSFDGIYCTPLPVQPRLPIWYGAAMNERLARRIAETGDGWYPIGLPSVEELTPHIDLARAALTRAGRDPDELGVRRALALVRDENKNLDFGATMAPVPELAAAGVTVFGLNLRPGLESGKDVGRYLEQAVAAFRTAV
jgi:probable F420-dependent oxidoreductase